jgi:hypothetical protein
VTNVSHISSKNRFNQKGEKENHNNLLDGGPW